MRCPSCGAVLAQRNYHDLAVDVCPGCKGIWFDAGELKEFIEHLLEDRDDIPPARIQLDKAVVSADDLMEDARRCPRCDEAMRKINYGYDSNIILDRCVSCGGLWADRDEILQLAIYKKGNPKLDALGRAVLKDKRELHALTDLAEAAESLKGPLGFQAFMPKIVLPLQADRTAGAMPGVTFCLIAANVAAFVCEMLFVSDPSSFVHEYGLVPSAILSIRGPFSLVSSMFLHAGLVHLLVNMFFFWIFAPNVEDALGHGRFLLCYFLFGFLASGLHVLTHLGSDTPALGASGAIAGVMGAFFVLCPQAQVRTFVISRVIDIPAWVYLGAWIALQILCGIVSLTTGEEYGIGWFAHIGGFASGVVLMWVCKRNAAPDDAAGEAG